MEAETDVATVNRKGLTTCRTDILKDQLRLK